MQENGQVRMVLWCPTGRAQKVCEDRLLGACLDARGLQAERDEAIARYLAAHHQQLFKLPDSRAANKLLGKLVRGQLDQDMKLMVA